MKIEYEIIQRTEIDDSIRSTFAEMLRKQGKVKGDLLTKADRCCLRKLIKGHHNRSSLRSNDRRGQSLFS